MLHGFVERLRQKKRTVAYPDAAPLLPERFRGRPSIEAGLCGLADGAATAAGAGAEAGANQTVLEASPAAAESGLSGKSVACAGSCAAACPAGAMELTAQGPRLDLGRCIFCGACAQACPSAAISFSRDHRLAASRREDLFVLPASGPGRAPEVAALTGRIGSMFKRSLKIRVVSAGGCGACEADCNVLGTIVFDLPRFGMDYTASPRHADAMLVSGPVPDNMRLALEKCHAAMPEPKLVLAVGACAISGGLFSNLSGHGRGVPPPFQPDLFIPGCPPHPYTILDGLLRLQGRIS